MKDYLPYQMMNEFGVAAPLCSYAYITVNGEDWGYLAVEEPFLQRNYGRNYGNLYKPDSMNFGADRAWEERKHLDGMPRSESRDLGREDTGADGLPAPDDRQLPDMGDFGGMGSSDVKLQYIDDDPDSYSSILKVQKRISPKRIKNA